MQACELPVVFVSGRAVMRVWLGRAYRGREAVPFRSFQVRRAGTQHIPTRRCP